MTLASVVAELQPQDLHARLVKIPMRVKFRGVLERQAVLLFGPHGVGEFSPFMEYPPEEAAAWLASGLEAAYLPPLEPACAAVPINATIPAVPAEEVPSVLERFHDVGTVKIKVAEKGQGLDEDLSRIDAVATARPNLRLRLDANRGYSVEQALELIAQLTQRGLDIDYLEQPCHSVEELEQLRGHGIAIAADESIRRADDPLAVRGRVDAAVLKVAPLGGIRRTLNLAQMLQDSGVRITIASALDTAVGIHRGAVAASLIEGASIRAAGLGTQQLFTDGADVAPSLVRAGAVVSTEAPVVDPTVGEPLDAWWQQHVQRSLECLRAQPRLLDHEV